VLTVRGNGQRIWNSRDQCYFVYHPIKGDAGLVAHLVELKCADPLGMVVLMIRESTQSDSPWAGIVLSTGDRVALRFRWQTEGITAGQFRLLPGKWIKLVRCRNSFLIRSDTASLQAGQMLDVLGQVEWLGQSLVLGNVRTRLLPVNAASTSIGLSPGDVRDIKVADLEAEVRQAQKISHHEILRLRGVVTFNGEINGDWLFFLQDRSGGAQIPWWNNTWCRSVHVGDQVELTGSPESRGLVPEFVASGITGLGSGQMPEAVRLSTDEPPDSGANGQWVELEGVVRSVTPDGTLMVMTRTGMFRVRTVAVSLARLASWVDALVRVRGVMSQSHNQVLLLPSERFMEMVEAPPGNPFDIPTLSIESLQTNENKLIARRLKVSGTVTYRCDDFITVQDGTGGMRVETAAVSDIRVGDLAAVVGFPSPSPFGWMLSHALLRPLGSGCLPQSMKLSFDDMDNLRNNGLLVFVEAVLLAQHAGGDVQTLDLQSGNRVFHASLPRSEGLLPRMVAGSRIQLTGVAAIEAEEISARNAATGDEPLVGSLELLLRQPKDVVVIQRPPWWNWKYTVAVSGAVILVLVGALLWIRTLQRRVDDRTRKLRETMDKLQLETQVSATLAERDRLAGEIHDSIEQDLSAIMIQIDTAAKLAGQPEQVKRFLATAKNMVDFSRAEVHHVVWNMRSPLLENVNLATALRRVAEDISVGDMPRVNVEIIGADFPLPPAVEHHFLRIAQEAITNTVKHGNARNIWLTLQYQPGSVALTVRDDGAGFQPDSISTNRSHFGLQGMRIRARKIDADFTLKSKPGEGTCISIVARHPEFGEGQKGKDPIL
jgi:signal transduction histidine kinase